MTCCSLANIAVGAADAEALALTASGEPTGTGTGTGVSRFTARGFRRFLAAAAGATGFFTILRCAFVLGRKRSGVDDSPLVASAASSALSASSVAVSVAAASGTGESDLRAVSCCGSRASLRGHSGGNPTTGSQNRTFMGGACACASDGVLALATLALPLALLAAAVAPDVDDGADSGR